MCVSVAQREEGRCTASKACKLLCDSSKADLHPPNPLKTNFPPPSSKPLSTDTPNHTTPGPPMPYSQAVTVGERTSHAAFNTVV